jgi:hypothetical protein
MKKASIIIFLIGLVITIVTQFNFVTKEKVVDIGKLEITADVNRGVSWSPIVGLAVMAIGAGVYMVSLKKS